MRGLIITLTQIEYWMHANHQMNHQMKVSSESERKRSDKAEMSASMLEDSSWYVRIETLNTLGKLEPAMLAQHVDALVPMLEDSDADVRNIASETLAKLDPATLAQHADALVAMLDDSKGYVRKTALKSLGKLEPAKLAQYTDALVAMIEDSDEYVRREALTTLRKLELEPATLTQHVDAKAYARRR